MIYEDGGLPENIELICSWLNECQQEHLECPLVGDKRLPDRVLCVSDRDHIYLDTNAGGKRGEYVALSHCWGTVPMGLQTKKGNIENLRRRIPLNHFPKNFRHAIDVCWKLKIDYLWIDSLCIIQDSKSDKASKIPKMDEIYSNCLFSIAADAGKDSKAGFLRTPGRKVSARSNREMTLNGQTFIVRRSCNDTFRLSVHGGKTGVCHTWSKPVDGQSPLSLRGWVLQETMLAPRTLHFCADELVWECNTHSRCECTYAPHIVEDSNDVDSSICSDFDESTDADIWPSKWAKIVSEFTFRGLTTETDRLNGLAGIVKQQLEYLEKEEGLSTKYIAGLWRHNLREGLHWNRIQEGYTPQFTKTNRRWDGTNYPDVEPHRMPTYLYSSDDSSDYDHAAILDRPDRSGSGSGGAGDFPSRRLEREEYIAPSWSWASITGRVRLNPWTQSDRDNMRHIGVDLDRIAHISSSLNFNPKDAVNKFGAAAPGVSLTVEAEIFHVRVLPRKRRDGTARWRDDGGGGVHGGCSGLVKGSPRFLAHFPDARGAGPVDFEDYTYRADHACHLDTDEEEEAVAHCNGRHALTAVNLCNYTAFIILREQFGPQSGRTRVYKRVGIIGAFRARPPIYKYEGCGERRRIRII